MSTALVVLLLSLPAVCSAESAFTMFTWIPGYNDLRGLERAREFTQSDWSVAILPGTFEVEVDTAPIEAAGVSFAAVRRALEALPRGAKIYWHVGWWNNHDGYAAPSGFIIPTRAMCESVEAIAKELGLVLEYTQGDV